MYFTTRPILEGFFARLSLVGKKYTSLHFSDHSLNQNLISSGMSKQNYYISKITKLYRQVQVIALNC